MERDTQLLDTQAADLANLLFELALDGADFEQVLAALTNSAGNDLGRVAHAYLLCASRIDRHESWERAASMVATAMRTGLFTLPPRRPGEPTVLP